jgi:GT2 family glycosyltransferase/glycosyltransferase involved in cell wall biosynthesis
MKNRPDAQTRSLSTVDTQKDTAERIPVRGNIDTFNAGLITGWAFDPTQPNVPAHVRLYAGQLLVAQGVANQYRADLEQAGIGKGEHGFSLELMPALPISELLTIRLLCNEILVQGVQYELVLEGGYKVTLDSINGAFIVGKIISDIAVSAATIDYQMFVDGLPAGIKQAFFDKQTGLYRVSARLPADIFDGMAHVIEIAVLEAPMCRAAMVDVLRPIFTPFHQLVKMKGAEARYYGGMLATESRRMALLHSRLASATHDGRSKEVPMLWTAYQILQEGHENLAKFPLLSLPKTTGTPDVSIIIPAYNKFELTFQCVASIILSSNRCSYEVIVADDCSTDDTTKIKSFIDNVKVTVNETNLGFVRNCNNAARTTKGRYLVFLNNDTEVGNGWLDEMLAVFERFDKVGAVGPKLTYPNGKLQEAGGIIWENGEPWNAGRDGNPFDPQWNYVRQCDYLSGAALMIPLVVWNEIGGFSDEFAPAYFEDADLAFKVRAAGYRTVYTPHAEVIHFEGLSHGKDTFAGIKKYQSINAPKFEAKWSDATVNNGRLGTDLWRNKERGIRYRVLVIDYATPEPDKNAGAYAAVQEMRLLQAHGCKVTFVPENLAHFGHYTTHLQKMGIECLHAPFCVSINEILQERGHEFNLVFITRYDVADRYIDAIRQHTRAKVLFNNADLHFLRELRMALANGEKDLTGPLATRDHELALYTKVDAILSYNESEHAVITSHILRTDNIFRCPWVINTRGHKTTFEKREGIAFLGGYRHIPNIEAVEFFVNQIMPLIRASGKGIKFHIYGSYIPESFKKFESDDVVLEGYIESLDDIFENCRIFVAPLLSGAGIKGKVLDAMSYGIPSVLSPVAVEATGLTHGISTFIASTPEEWAEKIIRLYENKVIWQKFSHNNLAIARENYSFENGLAMFGKALGYLGLFPRKADSYMITKESAANL